MKNLKTLLSSNKFILILLIFIIFYVFIFTKVIKYKSSYDIREKFLEGTITNFSLNGNKVTIWVKGKEKVIATFYLEKESQVKEVLETIHLGDKIKLKGSFKEPSNNTIPNTFNYKKYLNNKKIYYTFDVNEYETKKGFNPFYKLKNIILKRIYERDNKDYYLTFLLGDKALFDGEVYSSFQINGISHLLAISGMHIGVILLLLNQLLKKLKENKRFLVISLVLLLFSFLTGFSASVLRATIFFVLNKINKHFDLKFNNLEIIFMTAFVILIINPFMIYDVGFIYSFVVCFGIIYYNDKLKGNYFISLFKLSAISFLFSFPITASLNYEVNILSIFMNLIFVPLVSFIIYPLSLISFIFPFLEEVFLISINIMNGLNSFLLNFSIIINIPKMPIVLILIFYLLLLLGKNKSKLFTLLIMIVIIAKTIPILDSNYYICYLDVGQGDNAVLISPYKKEIIMIDTGGKITYKTEEWKNLSKTYNISNNTIKFLKSIGITKINYLILSHGDADHAGEAINIINNFKVKNVVLNNGNLNNLEHYIKRKSNVSKKCDLKYFKIKNLNDIDYHDENKNSIINHISFLKYNLLFMGDANVEQEKYIINKYKLTNIDIIKLGHHGSKTSTCKEFINYIKPKYGIISVGKNNRYGHPNKEVMETLKKYKIFRTDEDGSIIFKISKNDLNIETYEP